MQKFIDFPTRTYIDGHAKWKPPADLTPIKLKLGEWQDEHGWIHYPDVKSSHCVLFANEGGGK